ncbi:MAG: uracil-DNA glycosylase [Candidatus Colwellbacteria bacterium]|nr:uracil-DNA glycosylase [Candidatus Colwellbacteria bacterium]
MDTDNSLPLRAQGINLVFGVGDTNSKVVFIGEAPGRFENELKTPFVGRAGKLLDKILVNIGIPRATVYITNIVKHRPPENRDPLPEEIAVYAPYLKRELEILNAPIIAPLGRFSMNYFLPYAKISKDHGRVFRLSNKLIFPLYHPAAALRSTGVLKDLETDFKKLPELIKNFESLLTKTAPEAKQTTEAKNQISLF